ncbi:MAG: hypothetical protein P8Y29_01185 [Gemmatimonadota bacterium]|jgi:hypothetical protein
MPRTPYVLICATVAMLAAAPNAARAQNGLELMGYGFRAGASLDDELTQFLVGGHLDLGRPYDSLRVQTIITTGFGDDAFSFLLGGEAHYLFPVSATSSVEPYAGGGIGLHHINRDRDNDDDRGRHDDTTEAALLLVAGFDVPVSRWWGYFVEGRFLVADESVFRLEGGLTWLY